MNSRSLLVGPAQVGFTLDPVEVGVLRQAFGVRSRLFPLRLGSTTVDPVRFAALAAAVDEALDRRGLVEGGLLHPSVQAGFELLAEHRLAVSITGAPGDLTVLAVSDGVRALSVTQPSSGELRFAPFPADELVDTLVATLPPAPAGTPADTAEPRVGGGLLVASGRSRRGLWADMLGWVDTPRGRHLVTTATERYSPVGPAELTIAVTELLAGPR